MKQLLILARKLILDPLTWCQGSFAKNKNGEKVAGTNPEACQWCAAGAIYCAVQRGLFNEKQRIAAMQALQIAAGDMRHGYTLVDVNDRLGHSDVIQMFDRAINLEAV